MAVENRHSTATVPTVEGKKKQQNVGIVIREAWKSEHIHSYSVP